MKIKISLIFSTIALSATAALAQAPEASQDASETEAVPGEDAPQLSEDEMADLLNSQQQLQQTFTLRREVNGELVETEKRTVTFTRDEPYRQTEAGKTAAQEVLEDFDRDVLTRTEAFEEAKIDFTLADANHDGRMTADEFVTLVRSWVNNEKRAAAAPNETIKQQRRYDAFLQEISGDTEGLPFDDAARNKFLFMAGADETLSLRAYIREYMLDFDAMDADNNMLLKGDELKRFRAVSRGENLAGNTSDQPPADESEM